MKSRKKIRNDKTTLLSENNILDMAPIEIHMIVASYLLDRKDLHAMRLTSTYWKALLETLHNCQNYLYIKYMHAHMKKNKIWLSLANGFDHNPLFLSSLWNVNDQRLNIYTCQRNPLPLKEMLNFLFESKPFRKNHAYSPCIDPEYIEQLAIRVRGGILQLPQGINSILDWPQTNLEVLEDIFESFLSVAESFAVLELWYKTQIGQMPIEEAFMSSDIKQYLFPEALLFLDAVLPGNGIIHYLIECSVTESRHTKYILPIEISVNNLLGRMTAAHWKEYLFPTEQCEMESRVEAVVTALEYKHPLIMNGMGQALIKQFMEHYRGSNHNVFYLSCNPNFSLLMFPSTDPKGATKKKPGKDQVEDKTGDKPNQHCPVM